MLQKKVKLVAYEAGMEEDNMSPKFFNKTIGGLLLIGIGVLFLLNQTGAISLDAGALFADYWPVLLIYFGLQGIVMQRDGGTWNVFLVLFGAYLVLRNLEVGFVKELNLWQVVVPFLLIVGGLGMLTKGARYEERKEERKRQYREEQEQRRRERNERKAQRHQGKTGHSHNHSGTEAGGFTGASPSGAEEENVPPYDPAYTRKIEMDLDQVFHERVVKKLGDDPFPLVSDAQKPGVNKQSAEPDSPDPMGLGHEGKAKNYFGRNPPPPPPREHSWNAGWQQHEHRRGTVERSNFIGDIHLGQDYWQLEPTNVSHFIGDTVIDLTKANIPYGETKLNVSAFIGDVKVFVPNDIQLAISVEASAFIGDIRVLDRHEGGFFRNMRYDPVQYGDSEKRINLTINMFIGDVSVKRIG
jgi:lia operon protein LiaF